MPLGSIQQYQAATLLNNTCAARGGCEFIINTSGMGPVQSILCELCGAVPVIASNVHTGSGTGVFAVFACACYCGCSKVLYQIIIT